MGKVRVREYGIIPAPSVAPDVAIQRATQVYEALVNQLHEEVLAAVPASTEDGVLRVTGYDTINHGVELLEGAVKAAGFTVGPAADFSISIVIDGALSYKADIQKYVTIDGSEVSSTQQAEMLIAFGQGAPKRDVHRGSICGGRKD